MAETSLQSLLLFGCMVQSNRTVEAQTLTSVTAPKFHTVSNSHRDDDKYNEKEIDDKSYIQSGPSIKSDRGHYL